MSCGAGAVTRPRGLSILFLTEMWAGSAGNRTSLAAR